MENPKEVINVLILGETGVGKSTFINGLLNYMTYEHFQDAEENDLLYFVPTKFSLVNDEMKETIVKIGHSPNELVTPGMSSTQEPTSYFLELKNKNINLRLIDTTGIGDTRGMEYDERNTEKLLTFIGELDYLNCICILLKPNNSRLSVLFNYCIKHILLRLDQKLRKNIVFLFTNARSTFYRPGDTLRPLQVILNEIQTNMSEAIPLNSTNTFCVDNEAFRYLAAKSVGFSFPQDDIELYKNSWNRSSLTCKSLVNYVATLPAIPMQGILSVNESRRIVGRLAKPIIELMILYEKALVVLKKHEEKLSEAKDSMDDLRKMLYVPSIECIIGKKTKYSETKRTFEAGVSFSIFPPFATIKLGYEYSKDEKTEDHVVTVEKIVQDSDVILMMINGESAQKVIKKQIEVMTQLAKEYKNEGRVILTAAAVFSNFLKENAILFRNDPLELYLKNTLEEEEEVNEDPILIEKLRDLLVRYQVKKDFTYNISPKDVQDNMGALLKLKHSGKSFKFFYEKKYVLHEQRAAAILTKT